ncbi:MAG: hypothetical protein ABIO76_01395 [Ginsengibacter sp.]
MKNMILCFMMYAFLSCNNSKETPDMRGTYLMQSQILNDGTKDTKLTGLKQLKIFTESFFMYTQVNLDDSASSFGVGSYTAGKGMVVENVIYSSSDTTVGTPANYELAIDKNTDGYKQVIPEILIDGEKNKLTEEYLEVGTNTKAPLVGVWKETQSYNITGSDTAMSQRTQYKAYYDGYFMFGHSFKDSTSRTHTGIGFGTFEMKSDTLIRETDLNSTYSIIAGQSFDVKIEMDGEDKYKQTLKNADGSIGVEFYERLKK